MVEHARQTNILTESEKFSQGGVVSLLPYEKISAVFIDDKINAAAIQKLNSRGVELHTVPKNFQP